MANKNPFDFYFLREELFNENFNLAESREIKINEVGYNAFIMSPSQWEKRTNAIGIIPSSGRYSKGTYAHPDIAPKLTDKQKQYIYVDEADVLNVALFGMTAREWRNSNPNLEGNLRDYADILHLIVLNNLENVNAKMIEDGINQKERLEKLNKIAIKQLSILYNDNNILVVFEMVSLFFSGSVSDP